MLTTSSRAPLVIRLGVTTSALKWLQTLNLKRFRSLLSRNTYPRTRFGPSSESCSAMGMMLFVQPLTPEESTLLQLAGLKTLPLLPFGYGTRRIGAQSRSSRLIPSPSPRSSTLRTGLSCYQPRAIGPSRCSDGAEAHKERAKGTPCYSAAKKPMAESFGASLGRLAARSLRHARGTRRSKYGKRRGRPRRRAKKAKPCR
mmetsp:Transcript_10024/g.23892  ORF Transcript_10024/g.23892 Transcript_10024/m.23892 type:complete len:200 (-) Transcript_10024:991-1590(-)